MTTPRTTLTDRERAYLQERRFAVLATINADGSPQLSTMWYVLDENDTIIMNTKVGRVKERNMRRDPRIALCFEDGDYITMSGTAVFIDDPEGGQRDIHRLAVRYNGEEAAGAQMEEQFSKEHRVTVYLKCERIFADM